MSFQRYPKYKDSGVEWLGQVPVHWEVKSLKNSFRVIGGSTPSSGEERYWDGEIHWATPADLGKSTSLFLSETQRRITEAGLNSCGTTVVPAGSIILSTRAPIGSVAIAAIPMCTNQGCKSLVALQPVISGYWSRLLSVTTKALELRGKGTTFLELSGDELGNFKAPCPPTVEQAAIAAFLDRETERIDALVGEQERLIELLTEKRQAVISHAVTKGLNPDAPMKDSGIEWLGKVPAHWSVSKLKHLTPQLTVGIVIEPSKFYVDEGVPALRSLNVKQGTISLDDLVFISPAGHELHSKSRLRAGDLVAVRSGQPGTTAVVPRELDGCNCIDLIVIRRPTAVSEWFLSWYLASAVASVQFSIGSGGAIQQHFNVSAASELIVTVPPAAEQVDIVAYVVRETGWIDALIAEAQRAIDLLQERRTGLISAAVTGQIDVRSAVEGPAA